VLKIVKYIGETYEIKKKIGESGSVKRHMGALHLNYIEVYETINSYPLNLLGKAVI
jgi:hypothetical protein